MTKFKGRSAIMAVTMGLWGILAEPVLATPDPEEGKSRFQPITPLKSGRCPPGVLSMRTLSYTEDPSEIIAARVYELKYTEALGLSKKKEEASPRYVTPRF